MGVSNHEEHIALFNATRQVEKKAEEAAKGGTQKVEEELDKIIENVRKTTKPEPALLADIFLQTAARKIWEQGQSLEPVLYLYEKYYPTKNIWEEGTFGSFDTVIAKIAAELQGIDRTNVIDSAVAFITRHNSHVPYRVQELAFFARALNDNGASNEARQMATLLHASAENILNELPLANSYVQEIIAAGKQ